VSRLRGGTAGILAALAAGRLSPFDPRLAEERALDAMTAAQRRDKVRPPKAHTRARGQSA